MGIYLIEAATKDYLWGGERLREEYHVSSEKSPLAEAWLLSCHKDGESKILLSNSAKLPLSSFLQENPKSVGDMGKEFPVFPMLIKLIDAKLPLSVQVHPDDKYAALQEGSLGKTEVWVVLEREEGAFLYYGFKREYSKEEIRKAIEGHFLTEYLNKVPVDKGDVFFIPAGTVHAIGAGICIAEIQENSNLTYRVYDYGRKDKDGRERELHIEKALSVMNCKKTEIRDLTSSEPVLPENGAERLASCPYFTVERCSLKEGECHKRVVGKESFLSAILIDGSGKIVRKTEGKRMEEGSSLEKYTQEMIAEKGNSFFIPAGSGEVEFYGAGNWLFSFLEK